MKNVHLLPTNKWSRLYFNINDKKYQICENEKTSTILKPNRHIYITNDEEIKEGENIKGKWLFDKDTNKAFKCMNIISASNPNRHLFKIILTTDTDLIKHGVQSIDDDEFLEFFIKNPSCEEIEVEQLPLFKNPVYKIIIPQETLEEAAEKYINYKGGFYSTEQLQSINDFKAGAKWQQERMYSEEDLKEAFRQGMENIDYSEKYGLDSKLTEQEWFEQFKKYVLKDE